MWTKKLSICSTFLFVLCSCSSTDYFLNEFNVGDGVGTVDKVVSYSHLWYGNEKNQIDDKNSNHTYEFKFNQVEETVYACYVPSKNINQYKEGVKREAGKFGTRFDLDETVVDGKFLWLFQEENRFPVTWKEVTLDTLSFIDGNNTLIFACEKQKATIVQDLFTKETLNKNVDIYTMIDLIGDKETKKFETVKRNIVQEETKKWISPPQNFNQNLICSPYFTYNRIVEASVELQLVNNQEVISLPIATKLNGAYTSLFENLDFSFRLGDVYGNLKEQFKAILLDEKEYPYSYEGEDQYGYYKVSDVLSIIASLHGNK
jgi:lipoprotein